MRLAVVILLTISTASGGNTTSQKQQQQQAGVHKNEGSEAINHFQVHQRLVIFDSENAKVTPTPNPNQNTPSAQHSVGATLTFQAPTPDHAENTTPQYSSHSKHVNSNALLQPSGSGVVLQLHPQFLKNYPPHQPHHPHHKHIRGGGDPNADNHHPAAGLGLHLNPQFLRANLPPQHLQSSHQHHVKHVQGGGDPNTDKHQQAPGQDLHLNPQFLRANLPPQHLQSSHQHHVKHVQGGADTNTDNNPQAAELEFQYQPQFVLTGVPNGGVLQKQIQAPVFYNQQLSTAPLQFNFQNHLLNGAKHSQLLQNHVVHHPTVLAPHFSLPHYTPQPAVQSAPKFFPPAKPPSHLQTVAHGYKPSNSGGLTANGFAQNSARKPSHDESHAPAKPRPTTSRPVKVKEQPRHESKKSQMPEKFPDFSKMFSDYFQAGPYKHSNDESGQDTNLKYHASGDFASGDGFYKDTDGLQSTKTHSQENDDGAFQPCNFFRDANAKVVENENDNEQYGSDSNDENRNAYDDRYNSEEDNEESSNRYSSKTHDRPRSYHGSSGGERYRNSDEDGSHSEKSTNSQRPERYRYEERPNRQQNDEPEEEIDHSYNFRQHYKPNPEQHAAFAGRPSNQDHENDRPTEHSRNQNNESDESHGRPHQKNNSERHHGKYHRNNDGDSYSGRPSNQKKVNRPSSNQHESGNRHYNYHNDDEDRSHGARPSNHHQSHHQSDDDDDSNERPTSNQYQGRHSYNERPSQDTSSTYQRGNGESKSPESEIKTFHRYNYPTTPAYPREIPGNRPPQRSSESRNEGRRPQGKDVDTIGYYSDLKPVIGNSGIFYRSEKEIITTNKSHMR